MKRFLILLMVLGLITGSAATAVAEQGRDDRTVEASYYGAQLLYQFRSCALSGGAGCVTVETLESENSLTAKVTDAHGLPVSAWVVDAGGGDIYGGRVYGTFCGETTAPIRFDPGATLELWIGGEWHPRWWPTPPEGSCFLRAATTGTVRVTLLGVTTSDETASPSPAPSESPDPQSSPSGQPAAVERSVDLSLHGHLRAAGTVVAQEGSCHSSVAVVVQRKRSTTWIEIGSTTTDADGTFTLRLKDRPGRYRAIVAETLYSERECMGAISPVMRHRH